MPDFDRAIDLEKGLQKIINRIDAVAKKVQNKNENKKIIQSNEAQNDEQKKRTV